MIKKIRLFLLNVSIPLGKAIAKIARPECLTSTAQFQDAKIKLKNGDVLLCEVGWELSNYFIPCKYKHCGIFIDGWIYESTTHKTRKVLLEEFFFKKDRIAICRKEITALQIQNGIDFMEKNLGEPYDYGFSFAGSKAWYCSKFALAFFCAGDMSILKNFPMKEIFGEPTVEPDDFLKSFDLVATYN